MVELVRGHKGFRFRIYPTAEQEERLLAWEHALRFLWNLALEQRKLGLDRPFRIVPSAFDQIIELKELCAEAPFLAAVPRNVCAQLLVELDKASQRCFQKIARAPRWKRKGKDCLGLTEPHPRAWWLRGNALHFPKLGTVRAVVHRPLEGKPKACTIRRDGDQWFVSIVCEVELPEPAARSEPVVALDRGITHLIADSDGKLVQNPKLLEATLDRLAFAQRVVARRKRGSKNRTKAVNRVSRLHRKVRRQRDHFLHALSAAYAKSHGTVVVERLQTANMLQNRSLARRIADAGWSRLVEMLRYKLLRSGGRLVEVPAAYSSQTCSHCAAVRAESRCGERFCCLACGYRDHADLNAAKVLKSRANRSALPVEGAPPEGTRRSRKVVALRVPRRAPTKLRPSGRVDYTERLRAGAGAKGADVFGFGLAAALGRWPLTPSICACRSRSDRVTAAGDFAANAAERAASSFFAQHFLYF